MKVVQLIFLCFVCSIMTSCSIGNINWNAHKSIKNVELGMSKQEVVKIMGNKYMVNSQYKDIEENHIVELGYKTEADEEYSLIFVNDILKEWTKLYITKEVYLKAKD